MPKWLGPGLLFAGAAVGVSHLVQSTRAGAVYGLGLVLVVILANVVKYPGFAFGPRYAAATGTSLLEGYRRRGRLALWLYGAVTLGTMFTVQAAVTFATAGLAKAVFALDTVDTLPIAVVLLALCAALVAFGRYRLIDGLMKVVVTFLTLSTVAATILVLPRVEWSSFAIFPRGAASREAMLFVAPLVGWMPSAFDIAVWHSLWTLAKRRDTGHTPVVREAMLDFDIGYVGTAILALCFVLLGAGVMYGKGLTIPTAPGQFAGMVLNLYAQTLGEWSRPLIGACALLVMFSTTLTVVDGFPRALTALVARFAGPEPEGGDELEHRRVYWAALGVLAVGSVLLLAVFLKNLTSLVDLATTLSFFTAPFLAALNHLAVFSTEVERSLQPRPAMRVFSIGCIVVLSAFACFYLYLRFF